MKKIPSRPDLRPVSDGDPLRRVRCLLTRRRSCRDPLEVTVRGIATRDGKPLVGKAKNRSQVWIFFPKPGTAAHLPGRVQPGRKRLISKIPTGTYKVSVQQIANPLKDLLNFAFDPAHTTLKYDVTHDGQDIRIDLPKDLPRTRPPAMPKGRPDGAPGNGNGKGKAKDKEKSKPHDDDKPEPK